MPKVKNPLDGSAIYFEDDGGAGAPVVLHGGILDRVADVRESGIAQALSRDEFRMIFVDHRGLGQSDKPHDPTAYLMSTRAADALAVLDTLGIDRAHFVGMSWGGRLGFGIAEHAPDRVRSLVVGGQQPYEWPDSPLTRVVAGAISDRERDDASALVEAFESFWEVEFPAGRRASWIENDRRALQAAIETALSEGAAARSLSTWRFPCLIFMGEGDIDFLDQARVAAAEIPHAELLVLDQVDHYGAHMSQDEMLIDAVLRTLRSA
jgi:pimeloyl-ACP methyl ester carboxylesterase